MTAGKIRAETAAESRGNRKWQRAQKPSIFRRIRLLALGLIYFCLCYRAGPGAVFDERPGRIAFWCYNVGLAMWIFLHFFPIGWPQLNAVYEHGFAWARSQAFCDQTRFWQWMRLPGDVVFSVGPLIMGWDFLVKLGKPRAEGSEPRGRAAAAPAE